MRKEYNNTLIFVIKTMKEQGLIHGWAEGASIYFEFAKEEITPTTLANRAGKLLISKDVDTQAYYDYLKALKKAVDKKQVLPVEEKETKEVLIPEVLVKPLAIKYDDLAPVFGVDLTVDKQDTIKNKIMTKISDERFLLEYMGFNPGLYEVRKIEVGSWTTPVKVEDKNGVKKAEIILNEKFNVVIAKRKEAILYVTKEEYQAYLDEFLSNKGITPYDLFDQNYRTKNKKQSQEVLNDNLLMVCPGLEIHLGKLGSVTDFEDYSSKQALWRIKKVAEEIYNYQQQVRAGKLVIGVGNDYFNSDTVDDKTTAQTQQNNDTRHQEVYLNGLTAFMSLIETVKHDFNKVILKGNPGNHDERSSFTLLTNLATVFTATRDEKVDVELSYEAIRFSTYYVFGDNLIIYSHGKSPESKNISDADLARAAKYQFPEVYNNAKNVYIFAGHVHSDRENKFDKVTVFRTASLSGVDAWHAANVYLGQREGHSLYLIDKERGYVGKHLITLTEKEKLAKIAGVSRNPKANVIDAIDRALDLNHEEVKNLNIAKKIKKLNAMLSSKNTDFEDRFNEITEILGIDKYNEEQKQAVLDIMGYKEEVKHIENEMEMVKKLTLK